MSDPELLRAVAYILSARVEDSVRCLERLVETRTAPLRNALREYIEAVADHEAKGAAYEIEGMERVGGSTKETEDAYNAAAKHRDAAEKAARAAMGEKS